MEVRLNLGSGPVPLSGFINIDALPDTPGVDLVIDISEKLPFDDAQVDVIYASHILEHFATVDVPRLLAEWRRVLRPGGLLLIAVPDLEVIARMMVERPIWFSPPHNPWLGAIYGGQKDAYDFHKTGFNLPWLASLLDEADFGDVARVERFNDVPVIDGSSSPLPFGVNVSLNVRAVAGGSRIPPNLLHRNFVERLLDRVDRSVYLLVALSARLRMRAMASRRRKLDRSLDRRAIERHSEKELP